MKSIETIKAIVQLLAILASQVGLSDEEIDQIFKESFEGVKSRDPDNLPEVPE